AADPCREESHRQIMRLLAASGEPSAALQQYRALERTLREELGHEPDAATRQLAREIEGAGVPAVGDSGDQETSDDRPPTTDDAAEPGSANGGRSSVVRRRSSPERPNARTPERLNAPSGTVTLLLTDIEGSTALWERTGGAFKTALAAHHTL